MKIIATSDLHGHMPDIPECDLFVFAGDMLPGMKHIPNWIELQYQWLRELMIPWIDDIPAKHKIVIGGNHDFLFEDGMHLINKKELSSHFTYLQDDFALVTIPDPIEGASKARIYGTPWQPEFFNWSFNLLQP